MYLAFSAMAARSDVAPARWRKPFLNWMDGVEAGWAIPLLRAPGMATGVSIDGDQHFRLMTTPVPVHATRATGLWTGVMNAVG